MQNKFVAFLDLMGFKSLIENNKIDKLIELYKSALEDTVYKTFSIWERIPEASDQYLKINIIIISDSLIIWTENDDLNGFIKLVITVKNLLFSSIIKGLPLRGAICHGNLEMFETSFMKKHNLLSSPVILGNGLTKAYELERKQAWSGCVISNESIARFKEQYKPEFLTLDILLKEKIIISYPVPFYNKKEVTCEINHVINWPIFKQRKLEERFFANQFKEHGKTIDKKVQGIIDQTIKFYNFCWDNY